MIPPPTSHWYAVYTKPRWEKQVAKRLEDNGVITYCPLNKVIRQEQHRKRKILEPLFRSYLFVYIDLKDQLKVLQTFGALSFVRWLGKPATIRDEEIEAIRKFLKEYSNVEIENEQFEMNEEVRISRGPLMHQQGKIIQINRNTVKLSLPSLRIALYAEIDKLDIEKVRK